MESGRGAHPAPGGRSYLGGMFPVAFDLPETAPPFVRQHERVKAALPVRLDDGGLGVTRDISASGAFFRTDRPLANGELVRFSVELADGGGRFTCEARVVRVEREEQAFGVATHFLDSRLELMR